VIGIDDWAWRRNQRYGTIISDLELSKTIALLRDREPTTARVWLSEKPQIHQGNVVHDMIEPSRCSAHGAWLAQGLRVNWLVK
jgi:transposase